MYEQEQSIARIHGRFDGQPIYTTFDLDSLDPTVALDVSNLKPDCEGFRANEVLAMLHSLNEQNIIDGDVVCLMLTKNAYNKIAEQVATYIMFEILGLIAWNKKPA